METGIPKLDFYRTRFWFLKWLRWGWVFLERTRILSGIQFTTHFIEICVVETKRFVGITENMILTRQTCGQRSSRAEESKRRALGNYFSERVCYMFLISKCRGDWDLGPNASTEVVHRPTSQSPLILTLGTYSKFARKKKFPSAWRLRVEFFIENW